MLPQSPLTSAFALSGRTPGVGNRDPLAILLQLAGCCLGSGCVICPSGPTGGGMVTTFPIALFGDGSDGDIVITALDTPIDGILNAKTFTIQSGASVKVPNNAHCLIRASERIVINGPLDGSATIQASSALITNINLTNLIGATTGGSGGGGGGGGGDTTHPNTGLVGTDATSTSVLSGYGFAPSNPGTPGTGGAGGTGGADNGQPGTDGIVGSAGADVIDLAEHFQLYPAGPGGILHGSIVATDGANGGDGGAGSSGGGGAGGTGGTGGSPGGNGASLVLLVAPVIVLNALVSANGGNGSDAPNAGTPGGAIAGGDAPLGSNLGGGGGGGGGAGSGGGAGGAVLLFYSTLIQNVAPEANPGLGGRGGTGAPGGAGDGTGSRGGKGGNGSVGATGSNGYVIRQRIA